MNCIRYGLFACTLLMAGQANAANYVRYTAASVGTGTETTGFTSNGYETRQIEGLSLAFTVEFNDDMSYGSIVGAGKYIFAGAGFTGIGFSTRGAPTYGIDGAATFVFDNPGSTFPLGAIAIDIGKSFINLSEGSTSGLGFRFSGKATSLSATGGSANDQFSVTTIVPEPSSWALMLVGFGATGLAMRRRSTKVSYA